MTLTYLVVFAGVIAIAVVILKQLNAPAYIIQICWILLAVVIGVSAIRFLLNLP